MTKGLIKAIVIGLIFCAACCLVSCAKDTILDFANAVISNIGDNVLTKGYDLQGRRKFGQDSYTGTYSGEYNNDTVREVLFGSTSIERRSGNKVQMHVNLAEDQGSGTLLLVRDGKDPEILLDGTGTLDTEIDVCPGSSYLIFESRDFSGTLNVSVE